jgi:ribosomal protein S27E
VLLATQNQNDSDNKFQKHLVDSNSAGRFLRITFPGSENKTVAISEVEVYGKPAN